MDQVDLAQVGLGRIAGHAGAVPDRHACMDIALDPQAGDQADNPVVQLAEPVALAATDGNDGSGRWAHATGI